MSSGVVALEKLRPMTSMSGSLRNALKRVIVFPEPGGLRSIRGLGALTTKSTTLLRGAVSIVGTTISEDVTAFASLSIEGTLDCQGIQSPVVIWTSKSMRELSEFMSGRSMPVLGMVRMR
jgi:hypothetical protein